MSPWTKPVTGSLKVKVAVKDAPEATSDGRPVMVTAGGVLSMIVIVTVSVVAPP
jgi:hypothetical protein